MDILEKINGKLEEAELIDFNELPPDRKGLLSHLGVPDKGISAVNKGIHGYAVDLKDPLNKQRGIQIGKKDFNKLKNKNIRWIEIKSIGF
jgi:hypothetical protein